MIGIDTNLVLRLLLNDDPTQNPKIDALFEKHARIPDSILIADVVLAETIWTLRTAFKQRKPALIAAIDGLLAQPAFGFENREVVERAVKEFAKTSAGFSDCLIAAKNAALGCDFIATFDKKMSCQPGAKLL